MIFEGIAKRVEIGTAAGADAEQVGGLSIDYAQRGWALARAPDCQRRSPGLQAHIRENSNERLS